MDEFEVVRVDEQGRIIERQRHSCVTRSEDLGGGVSLELVQVPAGVFRMGTPGMGGYEDERPAHQVYVRSFWMGRYPVTQQQWQAVMRKAQPFRGAGLHHPADRVSWLDTREFCARLSRKVGQNFRLPGEAEWEYACRAGTNTPFHFGATLTTDLANYVGEHTYLAGPQGIYRHGTTPVGSFPPNAWGLYDMHGNVWEWCADDWHEDYTGAPADGSAWLNRAQAGDKVLRGGSWHEPPANCRSAVRLKMQAGESEDYFGFRVALSLMTGSELGR